HRSRTQSRLQRLPGIVTSGSTRDIRLEDGPLGFTLLGCTAPRVHVLEPRRRLQTPPAHTRRASRPSCHRGQPGDGVQHENGPLGFTPLGCTAPRFHVLEPRRRPPDIARAPNPVFNACLAS
ncbi:hypothetical protein AURDEDRAFT_160801, partial [Auricularia subglabra TFB-10046 SS5]